MKRADVLERTINDGGYQMDKQGFMVEIAAMQSSPEKQRHKAQVRKDLDEIHRQELVKKSQSRLEEIERL